MRSSFSLVKTSLQSFKNNFLKYLLILAIPTVITFFITYYEDFGENEMAYTISSILLVASVFISILTGGALIFASADSTLGVKEVYTRSINPFIKMLVLSLGLFVVILLGLMLLIIPGIYLAVIYAFPFYFLLLEQKSIGESLASSKALVKGRWWDVAVKVLVLCVAAALGFIIVEIISNIVSIPFGEDFQYALSTALANFVWPFTTIFLYELYKDLKNNPFQAIPVAPVASQESAA